MKHDLLHPSVPRPVPVTVSVRLTSEQVRLIRRAAALRRVSMADIVREAFERVDLFAELEKL